MNIYDDFEDMKKFLEQYNIKYTGKKEDDDGKQTKHLFLLGKKKIYVTQNGEKYNCWYHPKGRILYHNSNKIMINWGYFLFGNPTIKIWHKNLPSSGAGEIYYECTVTKFSSEFLIIIFDFLHNKIHENIFIDYLNDHIPFKI